LGGKNPRGINAAQGMRAHAMGKMDDGIYPVWDGYGRKKDRSDYSVK
jgi:hypothetical protein